MVVGQLTVFKHDEGVELRSTEKRSSAYSALSET